ncbi:fatty acid desaturase family protein [Roseateles cellulosilyticus]|uniref:Acyl-CoA desaturase n=1 Tax=Pelomonas cellulosilytica TaxID=2906762 RepID=A0ABS8XTU1_9BURK|nr:acyl-CoA desaturase [Pelomonas sp. P8]MCE4554307.1 acyl-CoA desaturase [Pelomonas sp. P8]
MGIQPFPQAPTDQSAASSLTALRAQLEAAGCFERKPLRAVAELVANLLGSVLAFLVARQLMRAGAPWAAAPMFAVGSFLFYRNGWLMHDAAHGGSWPGIKANRWFAALVAGVLGEFPSGWRHGHNRHHARTNVLGEDWDQRERWDPTRRYSSRWRAWMGLFLFTRYRGIYLPASLLFMGLRDGYYCNRHYRDRFAAELTAVIIGLGLQLGGFICLAGVWQGVLLFLLHTHLGMIYLNSAFAGNHYDLETFTPEQARELDMASLQARTTRNYAGGWWTHYVFGGLEKQLEHHLFPHLPRHHLHRAAPYVRDFVRARGLPYHEAPFWHCYMRVLDFHVDPPRTQAPRT